MYCASLAAVVVLALGLSSLSTRAAQPAPGRTIPLDITGPRPTAQLSAGDQQPVTVIFDSGAAGTVINTALAKSLGLESQGAVQIGSPGGGAPVSGFFAIIPAARLGNAELRKVSVVVADLPLPLPGISGVMSPNVFAGLLVRFELARARVVVVERTEATIPASGAHPYHSGANPLPAIAIEIAGIRLDAHLDTGSGRGLSMPIEVAKRVSLKTPPRPAEDVRMVGGQRKAFTAEIAGPVRIGPLTLVDPQVTFVEGVSLANVGFSILRNLTLVLDPAGKRSWLLPVEE